MKVCKHCIICKFIKALPKPQMMGNLPFERQDGMTKLFTYNGLDLFGQILKKPDKRYGVMFTCLTTRAVHLEYAPNLTTGSCLMAIRRMMGILGSQYFGLTRVETSLEQATNRKVHLKPLTMMKCSNSLL